MPCSKLHSGSTPQSAYQEFITDLSNCIALQISSSTDQVLWRWSVTVTSPPLCGAEYYGNCHQECQSHDRALTSQLWRYQRTKDSHFSHIPWQLDPMRHNALCKITLLSLSLHPCPAFHSRQLKSVSPLGEITLACLPDCPHAFNSMAEIACSIV